MSSIGADGGLDGLSDGARLERVRRLVAEQKRIAAELAAAVRDAETHQAAEHDGLKSVKSWLRTHTRLSGAAVNSIVRQGRTMAQLPAVEAAFAAGQVTGDQVEVIAETVKREDLDRTAAQDVDLAVVEDALLSIAVDQPYRTLQVAVGSTWPGSIPTAASPTPPSSAR